MREKDKETVSQKRAGMELNKLRVEHGVLEERLEHLEKKPLSVKGELLRREIKKKKLATKDKITLMSSGSNNLTTV